MQRSQLLYCGVQKTFTEGYWGQPGHWGQPGQPLAPAPAAHGHSGVCWRLCPASHLCSPGRSPCCSETGRRPSAVTYRCCRGGPCPASAHSSPHSTSFLVRTFSQIFLRAAICKYSAASRSWNTLSDTFVRGYRYIHLRMS